MKKNFLIFCLWLFFAPLLHAQNGQEPAYNGKLLSEWLVNRDYASSEAYPPLTMAQKDALSHIGTAAVPFLVHWTFQLAESNGAFHSFKFIQAFHFLGPLARSAIPRLVNLITNQPEEIMTRFGPRATGFYPLQELGAIGKDALPALLNLLTNSVTPRRRMLVINAIGDIGTNAFPALPVLRQYVNDGRSVVATEAVRVIGIVGAKRPEGLAALKEIMEQGNVPGRRIREAALMAFHNFGEECAPVIIPALNDQDDGDYYVAITTLVAVAPHALTNHTVLQIGATALQSKDTERRNWAAQLLRAAGQQARGQKPEYGVPHGNIQAVYQEAVIALRWLAPELLTNNVVRPSPR